MPQPKGVWVCLEARAYHCFIDSRLDSVHGGDSEQIQSAAHVRLCHSGLQSTAQQELTLLLCYSRATFGLFGSFSPMDA